MNHNEKSFELKKRTGGRGGGGGVNKKTKNGRRGATRVESPVSGPHRSDIRAIFSNAMMLPQWRMRNNQFTESKLKIVLKARGKKYFLNTHHQIS